MSTAGIGTPDTSRTMSNISSSSISPTLTSVVSTPRVGTEFKDRIFVGGFPPATTDTELRNFFSKFGNVKEAKIIRDHSAASKGYGFITYETEEEAKKVRESCGGFLNGDNGDELLDFKGRKLNIGPAIRKASNTRSQNLDVIPQGAVVLSANGTPFVVQNGLAFCAAPETYAVTHPGVGGGYPFIMPQQLVLSAHPQFMIPSSVQQAPGASMAQQVPAQSRIMLSPITQQQQQQQQMMSQQISQMKPVDSPTKMNMPVQSQVPNMNCSNNSGDLPNVGSLNLNGSNASQPNSHYRWTTSTMAGPVTQYVYPPGYQQTYGPDVHPHYPPMHAGSYYPPVEYTEYLSTSMDSGEMGMTQVYGMQPPLPPMFPPPPPQFIAGPMPLQYPPACMQNVTPNNERRPDRGFIKKKQNGASVERIREESPPPPSPSNARCFRNFRSSFSLPNSPANGVFPVRPNRVNRALMRVFPKDQAKMGNRLTRSPSRKMDMYGNMQPHRMNMNSPRYSTPQRSAYNGKYMSRTNVGMNNGYMRNNNGYNNCPECSDVQNINDGSNPTGVVTPPPTPIA